ncbi:hypothetical protein LSAT2_031225, partial [Lamellibrachia satsuma]
VVVWIILVVLSSTLPAGGAISDLQFCKEHCDLLFEVVAWIILIVLSSMLPVRGTRSNLQSCRDMCAFLFYQCITDVCPTKPWPLPVPQHCLNERLVCFEACLGPSCQHGRCRVSPSITEVLYGKMAAISTVRNTWSTTSRTISCIANCIVASLQLIVVVSV